MHMRHLHFKQRNRLPAASHAALLAPVTAAVQAIADGQCNAEHQATLAAAFSVAYRLAEAIPRHRHLLAELRPALDALTAIHERGYTMATGGQEIASLQYAALLFPAIIQASSAPHVKRALRVVMAG